MSYWMGIDGGGSNLRVVITADDLSILAWVSDSIANPGVVGHEVATQRIQTAVSQALSQVGLCVSDLSGIGIGIAGASVAHSEAWLRHLTHGFAPGVPTALSSDLEIALVGAHGRRMGVLILAGTGSAAFGINYSGESVQVGGWGYLVGDEGGSYWIGVRGIQMLTRHVDGREYLPVEFVDSLLNTLELNAVAEIIPWLYRSDQPRNRQIAGLAPVMLEWAHEVEAVQNVVDAAADELVLLYETLIRHLDMLHPPVAFAGGLLERDNLLSQRVCQLLNLNAKPAPKYPPAIGAALLAQLKVKGT